MIPGFRQQKQADFCECQASLVYKTSSRTARDIAQKNPVSNHPKKLKIVKYI